MLIPGMKVTWLCCMALLLAGCTGAGSVSESGDKILNEDEYFRTGFTGDGSATLQLSVKVTDGPAIDVYVLDTNGWALYEAGSPFTPAEGCSAEGVSSHEATCTLGPGSWYIVLDNTEVGTPPANNGVNDIATVAWAFTATE